MKRLQRLFLAILALTASLSFADVPPIAPVIAGSKTISCTAAGVSTALPTTIAQQKNLELQNAGNVVIFVETGDSTVTAAVATGYPVMPGQSKVISVASTITHVACIVAVTTTTLYVTVGSGN